MMSRKALNVTVELDIHAITCPGVWLCPNGKVMLRICTMKNVAKTVKLPPVFPLLFHEKFIFKKTFSNVRCLPNLQRHLARQYLYAELTQWPESDVGIILATFETSLLDILFPKSLEGAIMTGVDVDLLMEPSRSFPGILAPKIEVSTKTTIVEIIKPAHVTYKANTGVMNPKILSSKCIGAPASKHRICTRRQRKVCHSKNYPRKCPKLRGRKCHNQFKNRLQEPFVVRHVKDDIFNNDHFENDLAPKAHTRPNSYKCKYRTVNASPCQPLTWQSGSGRVYSPRTRCQIVKEVEPDFSNAGDKERMCVCGSRTHLSGCCTVCSQYKDYFRKHCSKYGPQLPYENKSYKNNVSECPGIPSECCTSQDYPTEVSTKLTADIGQQVDNILDRSRHYPFLEEKEIHSSSKHPYGLLSHDGEPNPRSCYGNNVSYREEFYQNLQKFYRKLYKRAKARMTQETGVC